MFNQFVVKPGLLTLNMFISRAKIVIGVVGLFLLSLLIAGLVLGLTNKNETESRVGAIVTNGIHCTGIGAAIFRKGFLNLNI